MSRPKAESLFQIIVYTIGILLLIIVILMPMAGPIKAATDLKNTQANFYQGILGKSNAMVEVAMGEDNDEDSREIFDIVFKYLTDIEISNPKTYIASQIPILDMLDLSSIIGSSEEPVVVTPPEDNQPQENPAPTENNPPKENEPYTPPKGIDESKPLVLIFHTHTTELYNPGRTYNDNFSTDLNLGVGRVGQELEKELEVKYGISTLHVTTIHDLPTRTGAYGKSRPTLDSYLKKYPSLKIVIDLHRDGTENAVNRVTAIINNEKYARPMFVIGRGNKNKDANIALSNKLNNTIESLYKGFSRGVVYSKFSTSKYNQDLSPKCVLLEIGSNENSLAEALNTAKIIARILSENIKQP